jgi:DNA-binding NarL/FixJ family response regulator
MPAPANDQLTPLLPTASQTGVAAPAIPTTLDSEVPSLGQASPDRLIRVLLVDDHWLVRVGLRSVLDRAPDIEIVGEAATGEEAVLLVERCKPDVVVMDLGMPGEGGIAATRTITSAAASHPSVLILTMHPEETRLVEALRAGANGYLTKDMAQQELIIALRSAVAGEVYVRPRVARLLAAALRPIAPSKVDETRAKFESLSEREQTVLREGG